MQSNFKKRSPQKGKKFLPKQNYAAHDNTPPIMNAFVLARPNTGGWCAAGQVGGLQLDY